MIDTGRPAKKRTRSLAVGDGPLTLAEIAQLVQLHPKAVVEYVRRGELVGQQIGRRWTFTQAAIDAFLEPVADWTFEVQFRRVNGEIASRVAPDITQPSAKTLKAVDKLVSHMRTKAAKYRPDPKEPAGPRARSDDGRFVGARVNEDELLRLPIFPAQWALDDPRERPYLVVWGNAVRAVKIAPTDGGNAVLVTLTSGETYRIAMMRRRLPRGSGTSLFYLCLWCRKPCRFLYLQTLNGDDLVEYLGPRCLRCAGLRFASQGRYRTKLAREFAPILGPRPRHPWDPWAVSDPRIAEKATEGRPQSGLEASDDADDADDFDLDDEDQQTRPYPGRPRAPKLARPSPGAGAGGLSDDASALVERFVNGLTGWLSWRIQNGIRYESPFPYLKMALDWDI